MFRSLFYRLLYRSTYCSHDGWVRPRPTHAQYVASRDTDGIQGGKEVPVNLLFCRCELCGERYVLDCFKPAMVNEPGDTHHPVNETIRRHYPLTHFGDGSVDDHYAFRGDFIKEITDWVMLGILPEGATILKDKYSLLITVLMAAMIKAGGGAFNVPPLPEPQPEENSPEFSQSTEN